VRAYNRYTDLIRNHKKFVLHTFLFLLLVTPSEAQIKNYLTKFLEDESAPGARAAMGLLAAGYGKALADEVVGFPLNTWQNRLTSIGIAALRYRLCFFKVLKK